MKIKLVSGDEQRSLDIQIGEERVDLLEGFDLYAGGNDERKLEPAWQFEAPPGHAIVKFDAVIERKWGESGYSFHASQAGSNFVQDFKVTEKLDQLAKIAQDQGQEKNVNEIKYLVTRINNIYHQYSSRNARVECNAYAKSREIKFLGVVIDTKTARVEMDIRVRTARLITEEQLTKIWEFLLASIKSAEELKHEEVE